MGSARGKAPRSGWAHLTSPAGCSGKRLSGRIAVIPVASAPTFSPIIGEKAMHREKQNNVTYNEFLLTIA